jgi:chemotaxis protein CheD
MASNIIKVGMADLKIAKFPDALTTLGLGSCIGIALYDPTSKVGGLVHIMLPDSKSIKNNSNIAKFADTGIVELVSQMIMAGAHRNKIVAKIAGGAKMFATTGLSDISNIGERNAQASILMLNELKIPLLARETGENYGRTVELYCDSGEFIIKSVGKPIKRI